MLLKLKIPTRLTLSILAFVIPLAYLLYAYSGVKQENINFASAEVNGDSYEKPLITTISSTNEAIFTSLKGGNFDSTATDTALKSMETAAASLGEDLKLTDDKLGEQKNIKASAIKEKWAQAVKTLVSGNTDLASATVDDSKAALDYVSLSSNLVLDPDLDSFYVMDVASVKIPTTLQRLKSIAIDVTPLTKEGISEADKTKIAVYASMLSDVDIAGVKSDFATALANDKDFYGTNDNLQKVVPEKMDAYVKANDALVATLRKMSAEPGSVTKNEFLATISTANKSATELWDITVVTLDQLLNARMDSISASKYTVWGEAAAVILAAFAFFWVVSNSIKKPLLALQSAMMELSKGNLETAVPCLELHDEIGDMAKTLQVFKNTSIEARNMAEAQRLKYEAEAKQKAYLDNIIEQFEERAGNLLTRVSNASSNMSEMAGDMLEVSRETTDKTKETLSLTNETAHNVTIVASAVEELSASINEISSQIAISTNLSLEAVSKTKSTDETVGKLSDAADKINEIVSLIGGIANQINLLALNATIESARAGEAGKGFAVVASEVKNLANQASDATKTIADSVTEIQSVVGLVVTALQTVRGAIEENNKVSTTIASAVEEQGAASREIASNINQANTRVQAVSSNMSDVSMMASHANDNSHKVLESAQNFSTETASLQQEVEKFLRNIKTIS